MKRAIGIAAVIFGGIAAAFGAAVEDDFETGHTPGETPVGWDQTWSTNGTPVQIGLMTVESGVGRDGSQGVSLDVTNALANYLIVNTNGVSGKKLILSADFQVETTDEDLTALPSALNNSLIGLVVKTSPLWWDGAASVTTFCRRDNTAVGLRIPQNPWVDGWILNGQVGLPTDGLEAATSAWFTITMELEDNGVNWTWTSTLSNEGGGELWTTPAQTLSEVDFPPGSTLYGGIHVGHNESSVADDTKGAISKVSAVSIDNFSFGSGSLVIAGVSRGGVVGHTFTSFADRLHTLQYSVDGGASYMEAGISILGDGAEHTLVDPATDTAGRMYRVVARPSTLATFDWEQFAGQWWQGTSYATNQTQNGITLQNGGRATMHDGGDGLGGNNGYGFKAAYNQDAEDGFYSVVVGGVTQTFTTLSLDIKGDGNNGTMPSGDLAVKGLLGGVEKWSIDPIEDSTFHTYTAATTGDLEAEIDQILWTAPYDANDTVLVWNNQIDNLTVALDPVETVASTSAVLDDAVVIEAAAFAVESATTVHASPDLVAGDWLQVSEAVVVTDLPAFRHVVSSPAVGTGAYRIGEPIYLTFFFDDFEGADTWTPTVNDGLGITVWERGTPNIDDGFVTIVGAHSGTNAWGTGLEESYFDGTDITLTSPEIDLAGATSATLEWMERRDIDNTPADGDDNGYVSVIDLDAGSTTLVHTSMGLNADWERVSVAIPASALGHRIRVSFRFVEENEQSNNWAGWFIDDVLIKE